jgi:hypothetical protein
LVIRYDLRISIPILRRDHPPRRVAPIGALHTHGIRGIFVKSPLETDPVAGN